MDKNIKENLIKLIEKLDDDLDDKFLHQLRIIIIKHLDKKGRH